ncbi:oligopeptide ABC transporter substrate-binding protein [Metasolibacillus meyeri]|uniref:Oligopeptide ABC transporter substrate-binding protein n=1 Tax=Metasolibacillus meyeri TaxID=1071052 RepID=A0AAW9NS71_9BACL|nr:oligopeptide ABC transporter substrate-binding protein [Metasolibacillus meyeri]MEC1178828.1 oligopeptide ABC transporter substrate-binding protein [Metasolibacillus meyeri]
MKKQRWALLTMLFALMLVLAACGGDKKEDAGKGTDGGTTDGGTTTNEETNTEQEEDGFSISVENEGTAIEGGTLMVAMQKDEPFQGIFSYALYEDAYDADLMDFASNSIFKSDGDFLLTDEGIASFELTEGEPNIVTIKIREGVKWSDGEPLKIEDLMLPYNIIGHKDYTGVRYNSFFRNIVGAEEYHDGTADTISGLNKIDETTLELQIKEVSPGLFSGGDGILTYAEPSHILSDVPVAELVEHDAIRKNPVTLGAFVIDRVVPGESVQFKANENYWKGKPKLDGVIVKVVPSASIAKALEAGEYDVSLSFGSSKYVEIENLTNIDVLAVPELYYSYLGFKVGKWDTETKEVATDLENSKMGDVNLRQAMAYALNVEEVTEVFYDGLRERANAIVPPVFSSFHDASIEGYKYDPDKANQLLDDAGFVDVDGDGIREDKEGKPLEIKFATMSGDDVAEQISAFWLQNWKEIGLNVVYTDGRTIEFNSFYDKVEADDPNIDIFMAAWGVGTNPSPSGIYAHTAAYNFSRYTSENLQTVLSNIDSNKSFDATYRAEQFAAFEKEIAEVAPVVPMMYRLELTPVNKRVKNWSVEYGNTTITNLELVELVADAPVK